MALAKLTDKQIKDQVPTMIEKGCGPWLASKHIGTSLKRLKKLATKEQLILMEHNKQLNIHKGRDCLPRLPGLETQAGIQAAVDEAIAEGLTITQTFNKLSVSHYILMKNITDAQELALRKNRAAKLKHTYDVEDPKKSTIKDVPQDAGAIMRQIIETHPHLSNRF